MLEWLGAERCDEWRGGLVRAVRGGGLPRRLGLQQADIGGEQQQHPQKLVEDSRGRRGTVRREWQPAHFFVYNV